MSHTKDPSARFLTVRESVLPLTTTVSSDKFHTFPDSWANKETGKAQNSINMYLVIKLYYSTKSLYFSISLLKSSMTALKSLSLKKALKVL